MAGQKRIWKFPLLMQARQNVTMFEGWKFLHLGVQDTRDAFNDLMDERNVCIWAEVDPYAPKVFVEILLVGTGDDVPNGHDYLGTIFVGNYVFHVYARVA